MRQPTEATPYLKIDEVWKAFGDFVALQDISLEVRQGEFVCFLGPSGCGKTTLLRAIAGLDIQTFGRVYQDGRDISALPPSQRDFGIVFQSYALFPNLTVEKNIAFGLENSGMARGDIARRVADLLELVGLPDQARKYPAQLSGGQQQRIALARAIAMSPGLLLLDEPLSALDAKVRVHLRHEVKELQRKLGVTTIMVTHDQEEALAMADRIVVMNHGVIEQVGPPAEIYREPRSLFVADFIGETNQLACTAARKGEAVAVGKRVFASSPHGHADGDPVIAVIRPEDIIPHGKAVDAEGAPDTVKEPKNTVAVGIDEMEFLGSFWRARLSGAALGAGQIVADFSINAVRRMTIETGGRMKIEIPSDRLKVFAPGAEREA